MTQDFTLSLEFFPPKSLEASFRLWSAIEMLSALQPEYATVTYGAGGTTRDITKSAVSVIRKNYNLPVLGHLTCVGATKGETLQVAENYLSQGATGIVALRGDPPQGTNQFQPHPGGFDGSVQLIKALAKLPFKDIRVGAYPHKHPEAQTLDSDIDALKAKFDAGATSAITQFFFEADDFLWFRDKCVKAGITQTIVPGILPIENWSKTRNFAAKCGVPVPGWMDRGFRNAVRHKAEKFFSTALCSELCSKLLSEGVDDLHFYTLNDPVLTMDVCRALGRQVRRLALQVA